MDEYPFDSWTGTDSGHRAGRIECGVPAPRRLPRRGRLRRGITVVLQRHRHARGRGRIHGRLRINSSDGSRHRVPARARPHVHPVGRGCAPRRTAWISASVDAPLVADRSGHRMSAWPFRAFSIVVGCLATTLVFGGFLGSAAASPAASTLRVATLGDFESTGVDNQLWADAVIARFTAANERGGVLDARHQRHKVEVIECNTASDPDQTARCAQQAVDQHVAAVVGMSVVYADRALRILEAARIPAIGVRVNAPSEAASPSSFPIASGTAAELAAMPQLLAQRGATKIAVIISDFGPATDELLTFVQRGLALTNAVQGPTVRIAPGASDYAAAVKAATQPGVDGIAGFIAGGQRPCVVPGAAGRELRREVRHARALGQRGNGERCRRHPRRHPRRGSVRAGDIECQGLAAVSARHAGLRRVHGGVQRRRGQLLARGARVRTPRAGS